LVAFNTPSNDTETDATLIATYNLSKTEILASLQYRSPLDVILSVARNIIVLVGIISAILTSINPDSEGRGTLRVITAIAFLVFSVSTYVSRMLGSISKTSSANSSEISKVVDVFSQIECYANVLQCQVNVMTKKGS
jgi:putative Ca2+/H+ antiporter (TMEM165/GDT1 family)